MPTWKIHNKWAERMGIPSEITNYVNSLIDFPKECSEYLDFCAEIIKWSDYYEGRNSKYPFRSRDFRTTESLQSRQTQLRSLRRDDPNMFCKLLYIGHDSSRSRSQDLQAHIQLSFLNTKGTEYIKAWYLHHILDYIEKVAHSFSLEEMFERLNDRTRPCDEFDIAKSFVRNHQTEILQDLGYDEDH